MRMLPLKVERIVMLVDLLGDLNKQIITTQGKVRKLASRHGITLTEFTSRYEGHETNPDWLSELLRAEAKIAVTQPDGGGTVSNDSRPAFNARLGPI